MDCATFQTRLDAFLDGMLSAYERQAAETHLASCARCRELWTLMRTDLEVPSLEAPAGLAASILKRTSGAPCDRAHLLLDDYVDGRLEDLDRELVRGHLEHCRDCTAVAAALAQLAADLPAFAELQPDPRFVHDVLAVTRARRRRWAGVWATRHWERLLERPRIAMEAGYVGAVVLWLVFGASWSPLRAAAPQLLAVVQQNPVQELALGSGAIETLNRRLAAVGGRAWEATGQRAVSSSRALGAALADRYHDAAPAGFRQHWRELTDAFKDLDGRRVVRALRSLREDAGRLWDRVVSQAARQLDSPEDEDS